MTSNKRAKNSKSEVRTEEGRWRQTDARHFYKLHRGVQAPQLGSSGVERRWVTVCRVRPVWSRAQHSFSSVQHVSRLMWRQEGVSRRWPRVRFQLTAFKVEPPWNILSLASQMTITDRTFTYMPHSYSTGFCLLMRKSPPKQDNCICFVPQRVPKEQTVNL